MSGAVERSDAPPGKVALVLAALVAALLLVCAAVAGLLILFDRRTPPQAPPPPAVLAPPEPRLQVFEPLQRSRLERDAASGAARIDAAMQRTAARGWPEGGGGR